MFASNVLVMLSPLLMAPWTKELEAACKEVSKKIEKQAKSMPQKKLTKAVIEKVICAEAGNLGKRLPQVASAVMKKGIETEKKKVEAEIKKKDPATAQALELTGLRDDLIKARKERNAVEPDKPKKLPKPMGGGLHIPYKIKVLTKDNVKLEVEFFIGINYKDILKGKPKGLVNYGGVNLIGRF